MHFRGGKEYLIKASLLFKYLVRVIEAAAGQLLKKIKYTHYEVLFRPCYKFKQIAKGKNI